MRPSIRGGFAIPPGENENNKSAVMELDKTNNRYYVYMLLLETLLINDTAYMIR